MTVAQWGGETVADWGNALVAQWVAVTAIWTAASTVGEMVVMKVVQMAAIAINRNRNKQKHTQKHADLDRQRLNKLYNIYIYM
jgi:hypothetical protein